MDKNNSVDYNLPSTHVKLTVFMGFLIASQNCFGYFNIAVYHKQKKPCNEPLIPRITENNILPEKEIICHYVDENIKLERLKVSQRVNKA